MKEIIREIIEVSNNLSHAITMGYKIQTQAYQNQLNALVKALEVIVK